MSVISLKIFEQYTLEDYFSLIDSVDHLLEKENHLIYIPKGKILIVGDLHGDLETLEKILEKFFKEKFDYLLFLGDYVDRGAKQVEVINTLFYYKTHFPSKIILIRGNHEDRTINRQYGFYDELRHKFNDHHKEIFNKYNKAFSKLPLAAITWNRIFCIHGGIPEGLEDINVINSFPKNQITIKDSMTKQLLWNDPHERGGMFKRNSRGVGIKKFGKTAFMNFITLNSIRYIIRSHEKFKNGFKEFFDGKLISIFSSHSYFSKKNSTVIGIIEKSGNIKIEPI
ncbi:MAG: metallophosphoesterase [Promethearchaeota archaeon]